VNGNYTVFIAHPVLEASRSLPRATQVKPGRLIRKLTEDPFLRGEFQDHDDVGRPLEGVIVGEVAVFFWADHAVRKVKIVSLRSADK